MDIKSEFNYTHTKRIGVGKGMNSEVYLVDDPQRAGEIVVKEIPKASLGITTTQFFQEAQAMHAAEAPNVVPLYCATQTTDKVCIAMPYFKRGSLGDRIEHGPLPPLEVMRIAQGILRGVGRIHAKGFIHFDVKPSNVLFDDNDVPMVADFGQTRRVGAHGVTLAPNMYPYGIPPEWFTTGHGLIQSDIYQVGLTLYRAVNGDPLFQPQCAVPDHVIQAKTLAGKFPCRETFLPHVPKPLRTIIRTALRVKPAERFATAAEFADALARVTLRHDWSAKSLTAGGMEWVSPRAKQPALVVKAASHAGVWDVQTFTRSSGKLRAQNTKDWKTGLSSADASRHLKYLFEGLEK